jgi:predicted ester cyclase
MIDPRRKEADVPIVQHLMEAVNRRDAFAAATHFALEAKYDGVRVGREGMRRFFKSLFTAFPDWHADQYAVLEGQDVVICRAIVTGTHRGTPDLPILGGLLVGIPPTGRTVKVCHVYLYRIGNDEIVEKQAVRDDLGLMRQLGLVPATPRPDVDAWRPSVA